jgi:hypothetical protein
MILLMTFVLRIYSTILGLYSRDWDCTVLYSKVECSKVQDSTVQYSTVLYRTV